MTGRPRVEHLERPDWCAEIVVPGPATVRGTTNTEHAASGHDPAARATTGDHPPPSEPGSTP